MFSRPQYEALRNASVIVDRTHRGRLLVTGTDRRGYLQGLLTNDIAALGAGAGCYAAYLTPQGRMISDMRVFETGDAILIDLEGQVAASVRDRLSQFIFSEDVEVHDWTASKAQIGVYGPQAAAAVAAFANRDVARLNEMPVPSHAGIDVGHLLRGDDVGVPGFDLVVDAERSDEVLRQLRASGAIDIDADVAEVCRIEAGRPRFGLDMDDETIPLEAGIEDRAISFTKGCYVGQEIIIRVLHRGHGRVARRLVGFVFDPSADVPQRGAPIHAADREIGRITSAARSPSLGRPIALGYVHRDFTEPGSEVTVSEHRAVVSPLPFVPNVQQP